MKNKYKLICLAVIIVTSLLIFYKPNTMSSFFKSKSINIGDIDNITVLKNYINEKENIPRREITINNKKDIEKIFNLLSSYKIRRTIKTSGKNYGATYIINIGQKEKHGVQIYQTGYDIIVINILSNDKMITYKLIGGKNICDKLISELDILLDKK